LPLHEAAAAPRQTHQALLRFRSDAVAKLVGVEFRRVRVQKGIWSEGAFVAPNIRLANQYSLKCLGRVVGDRSIWAIEPVDRYVAPETLYEQLVVGCSSRIHWGTSTDFEGLRTACISTAPLPAVLQALHIDSGAEFDHAQIVVSRFRAPKTDAYQTVYFPDHSTPVYRASLTGSLLIVEATDEPTAEDLNMVFHAMGLSPYGLHAIDAEVNHRQRFGKIVPLPARQRNALLWQLTSQHGIYSLGRYATWRNILLDDVVEDIAVIKRLSRAPIHELAIHAGRA
jgi:hypothetical protein